MATIDKFEELEVWQRARALAARVYRLTHGERFSRDFGLRDQIQRAAVSIVSNIAEGFGRRSNNQFIQFLERYGNLTQTGWGLVLKSKVPGSLVNRIAILLNDLMVLVRKKRNAHLDRLFEESRHSFL